MRAAIRKIQLTSASSIRGNVRGLSHVRDHDVVVVSFARTPIGKLAGGLSSLSAPQLGSHCIEAAVQRAGIDKSTIEEAYMGCVVAAGVGQAPTRQAVIGAGLPLDCPSTTVRIL